MPDNLDLFDQPIPRKRPLARTTDPHTSKDSANSADDLAAALREQCLSAIKQFGPMTGHEVAARLNLGYDKVHKRLPELRDLGLLAWKLIGYRKNGDPLYLTRLSPSGRQCCVWFLGEAQ